MVNNQNCPNQLEGYQTSRAEQQNKNLRNQVTLDVPQCKASSGRKAFQVAGASDWNSLPTKPRKTTSVFTSRLSKTEMTTQNCFIPNKYTRFQLFLAKAKITTQNCFILTID